MAFKVLEDGTRIQPNSSRRLIRHNYRMKTEITIAEAADELGVGVGRVSNLLSKGYLAKASEIGPYRILRQSVLDIKKNGIPRKK